VSVAPLNLICVRCGLPFSSHRPVYSPPVRKEKPVVCTTLMITVMGPREASAKRIRFVEDILRNCIKTLDRDFRRSRIPQMKGFSLRPEPDRRKRRKRAT
jgi:hypothetical protein